MVQLPLGNYYEQKTASFGSIAGSQQLFRGDEDRILFAITVPALSGMYISPDPAVVEFEGIESDPVASTMFFKFRDWGTILGQDWYLFDPFGGIPVWTLEVLYRTRSKQDFRIAIDFDIEEEHSNVSRRRVADEKNGSGPRFSDIRRNESSGDRGSL